MSRKRAPRVRIGRPDPTLTGMAGLAAVTELVDRLGLVEALDAGIGPLKRRVRGLTGGQLLVGMAVSQLRGESSLAGLDRSRADVAGGCWRRWGSRRRGPRRGSPSGSAARPPKPSPASSPANSHPHRNPTPRRHPTRPNPRRPTSHPPTRRHPPRPGQPNPRHHHRPRRRQNHRPTTSDSEPQRPPARRLTFGGERTSRPSWYGGWQCRTSHAHCFSADFPSPSRSCPDQRPSPPRCTAWAPAEAAMESRATVRPEQDTDRTVDRRARFLNLDAARAASTEADDHGASPTLIGYARTRSTRPDTNRNRQEWLPSQRHQNGIRTTYSKSAAMHRSRSAWVGRVGLEPPTEGLWAGHPSGTGG